MKIPVCAPEITEEDVEAVAECVRSTWVGGTAPVVSEFEEKFAKSRGCKYGIAVNSGTSALHDALASVGVGRRDDVIIPTFTMIATPNSVRYLNALPVLVDSELRTWNIDPSKIKDAITDHTVAIMPVHTYGNPADMDIIMDFSKEHGLYVIGDAAEAHGAEYKERDVGEIGDMACYSFYPNKIITTGEGGMIVTNNEELAEKARWLRAHAFGKEGKHFFHEQLGYGYRMSGMQAALGLSQLKRLDKYVNRRIERARLYNSLLSDIDGITFPPYVPWSKNVYWMYSILIQEDFPLTRNQLMAGLEKNGIETRTFFYPVHVQPIYLDRMNEYPVADELSRKGMNLPSGNNLTEQDVRFVCDTIHDLV